MLLPKRIKSIRQNKGFTQQMIAESMGIEQSTYNGFENEAGNLRFHTIQKIAIALECTLPFLVDIDSSIYDESEWRASITK
jgi:transcriptional regulator with XRE-family HTH domain